MKHHVKTDLTGQTFNAWTVLAPAESSPSRHAYWLCRCKCGTVRPVEAYALTAGRSRSCRPCSAAVAMSARRTHGKTGTKLYRAWLSMKTRCYNPRQPASYRNHGGLGIRVCDKWLNDFNAFAEDVGEPPSPHHSLGRLDPARDFEPGNVAWMPAFEAQKRVSDYVQSLRRT